MASKYKTQYTKNDDGTLTFTDYEITVKAKTLKEATEHAQEFHGIDVTQEPPKIGGDEPESE